MNDTINRVIVPGTFDPITFGHIDVIRRARRIFPSVIVAVAESQGKNGVGTTFMLDERVALAREALGNIDGVEVLPFTGLLVDFAREQGAGAVVKGLRAMTDFEYELQQADLNYRLDSELESIFVMSAPQYGYISSSSFARSPRSAAMYRRLSRPTWSKRLNIAFRDVSYCLVACGKLAR